MFFSCYDKNMKGRLKDMLKALVLAHYDFKNKDGKEIKTTKLRVSLNEYGYLEVCSELANDIPVLESVSVSLEYDAKYNRYKVTKLNK